MNLKLRKLYALDGFGSGAAYTDKENIDYEGLKSSLERILERVSEKSELHNEIQNVENLAIELTNAWVSPESTKAKNSIDEVNSELANVRIELANLIEELSRYHDTAKAINDGAGSSLNND